MTNTAEDKMTAAVLTVFGLAALAFMALSFVPLGIAAIFVTVPWWLWVAVPSVVLVGAFAILARGF